MDNHPFAQKQKIAQVQKTADASTGAPADYHRLDLGQVAFLILGKTLKELFAGHQAQHGIAQKLQALIGRQTSVGPRGVRQGGAQQLRLAELIADGLLAFLQNLGLMTRR